MKRNHIVKVATLDDGEVQEHAWQGEPKLLSEVLEALGVDVTDYNAVQLNNVPVPADELEALTVQNGDQVFLVPLIEGGKS